MSPRAKFAAGQTDVGLGQGDDARDLAPVPVAQVAVDDRCRLHARSLAYRDVPWRGGAGHYAGPARWVDGRLRMFAEHVVALDRGLPHAGPAFTDRRDAVGEDVVAAYRGETAVQRVGMQHQRHRLGLVKPDELVAGDLEHPANVGRDLDALDLAARKHVVREDRGWPAEHVDVHELVAVVDDIVMNAPVEALR